MCKDFVSDSCVNGSCPIAIANEYPWMDTEIKSCKDCYHNRGRCDECIFEGNPEYCPNERSAQ